MDIPQVAQYGVVGLCIIMTFIHKQQIERICTSHEKTVERNAQAFEAALASRDEQLKRFIDATLKNQNA